MSEANSPPEEVQDALDRLYDDSAARIADLQEIKPSDHDLDGQVGIFKALGNTDRLRLLAALRESECCVCELQVVLDAPQSTVATHLRKLKDAGLVNSRKKGKWSYYRIADTAVFELLDLSHAIRDDG